MSYENENIGFDIYDNSPVAYSVVEVLLDDNKKPYDWIYRYCNHAFAEITGYRCDAMINHTALSLFALVDEKCLELYYKAAYQNQSFHVVLENKYDAVFMPTGTMGLCSITLHYQEVNDDSDSYDSDDRQNYVINKLSADYVSLYHIELNSGKYEILRLNQNTNAKQLVSEGDHFRVYDTFDEFCRAYTDAFISDQDREEFLNRLLCENMKDVLMHNDKFTFHYQSTSWEGKRNYYEAYAVKGKITADHFHICLGFRNIDSILYKEKEIQTQLEKALEEARLGNEIITAIAKTYQYISRIDLKENRYEEISNHSSHENNYPKSGNMYETNKKMCEKYVDKEYQEAYLKFSDISTLARRMKQEETIAMEYKMKDGDWHKLRFVERKRDINGNLTHAISVIRNIGDEKIKEQTLLSEVNEARKDAAYKTRFLSNMSHDIRTPINGIVGMIDLAESNPKDTKMQKKCMDKIKLSAEYLVSLVDDILAMSKLESEAYTEQKIAFDLAEILNWSNTEKQKEAAEKDIDFVVDWENSELNYRYLYGNPVYLERVLTIVLKNAVKFTNSGGSIRVWCKEKYTEDHRVVYEFVCSDTGIGMSEKFMDHAFDMFSQENESSRTKFEGTGLGLAIAKKLVDRMKGSIQLVSQIGVGTTVTVTIPFGIADEDAMDGSIYDENISIEGMRALVVEDNELNMEIAQYILENNGLLVDLAVNGEEAVEMFKKSEQDYYDVIFMDIMMPGLNGWDATRKIRTMKRQDAERVPIIAMSANAFAEDIINSKISGMNKHLTKPIDEKSMIQAIKESQYKKES